MSGEKTEQPTAKKRRESRRQGQVFKSRELLLFLTALCQITGVILFAPAFFRGCNAILHYILTRAVSDPLPQVLLQVRVLFLEEIVRPGMALIGLFITGIIVSHVVQFGVLVNMSALKFSPANISPHKGLKKIISWGNLWEFAKSVIKVTLLTGLLCWLLRRHYPSFVRLVTVGLPENMAVARYTGLLLIALFFAGLFVTVVIDIVITMKGHQKKMMMSKEEIKNEYKESEGNSEIKGQRKQLHREMQQQDVRKTVKKSRCVIVNPTHYAVGIDFREEETPLPLITFKEQDTFALYVRRIARREGIPVIEKKYLARYLFRFGSVGSAVPPETFGLIADILHWLEQQDSEKSALSPPDASNN